MAITKYVTWNLDQQGVGAITRSLPYQTNLFSVYQVAVKQQQQQQTIEEKHEKTEKTRLRLREVVPTMKRRRTKKNTFE